MSVRFEEPPALPRFLEHELPYRRRAARVDGLLIHFIDALDEHPQAYEQGRGQPVLLVHGNPTWSFLWRKVIAQLCAEGYRLIAPDLAGFGLSDKPFSASFHQLERHVEIIGKLVDALELERLILVGQDWGGPIVTGVGERRPEQVGGLVLANTSVLRPARPFRPKGFHRFAHTPLISDLVFRGALFPTPILDRVQGDPTSIGWFEKLAYAYPHRLPWERSGPLALARMVPNRESHPTTRTMDRIGAWVESYRGPAGLVWGLRDPVLGRALRRHKEALPQAQVWECDAGHFLQEEVPELISDAIREVHTRMLAPIGQRAQA